MAIHICAKTAFLVVPKNDLIRRCCLIHLKNLCKASHKLFYDKFIVMRSHGKCISDYQNVTFLLLVSALHNNMVAMTSIRLKVRTNGYQKAFFKRFSAIFAY